MQMATEAPPDGDRSYGSSEATERIRAMHARRETVKQYRLMKRLVDQLETRASTPSLPAMSARDESVQIAQRWFSSCSRLIHLLGERGEETTADEWARAEAAIRRAVQQIRETFDLVGAEVRFVERTSPKGATVAPAVCIQGRTRQTGTTRARRTRRSRRASSSRSSSGDSSPSGSSDPAPQRAGHHTPTLRTVGGAA